MDQLYIQAIFFEKAFLLCHEHPALSSRDGRPIDASFCLCPTDGAEKECDCGHEYTEPNSFHGFSCGHPNRVKNIPKGNNSLCQFKSWQSSASMLDSPNEQ